MTRPIGGRDSGLLHLFSLWADGAEILAGTAVPARNPMSSGPRVSLDCDDCPTTVFGVDEVKVAGLLARHRRRCHG